jgi:hypothetical protein
MASSPFKVGQLVAQKSSPSRKGTVIRIIKPGPYGSVLVKFPGVAPATVSPDQLEAA